MNAVSDGSRTIYVSSLCHSKINSHLKACPLSGIRIGVVMHEILESLSRIVSEQRIKSLKTASGLKSNLGKSGI